MDLLFRQILPYQSLYFFHQFLAIRNESVSKRKQYLRLLFILIIVKSVHYLVLSCFNPPTTGWRLVLNDAIRLTNIPAEANFLLVVESFLLGGYCLYMNYFTRPKDSFTIAIFAEITSDDKAANENNKSTIADKNIPVFTAPVKKLKSVQNKSSPEEKKHLQNCCLFMVTLFQSFIVAAGSKPVYFIAKF